MIKPSTFRQAFRSLLPTSKYTATTKYPQSIEEKRDMTEPYQAGTQPKKMELQVGRAYWYCACGLSKIQPFCNGSHNGSQFSPIMFVPTKTTNFICLCRNSKNLPFCDGSHNVIEPKA